MKMEISEFGLLPLYNLFTIIRKKCDLFVSRIRHALLDEQARLQTCLALKSWISTYLASQWHQQSFQKSILSNKLLLTASLPDRVILIEKEEIVQMPKDFEIFRVQIVQCSEVEVCIYIISFAYLFNRTHVSCSAVFLMS